MSSSNTSNTQVKCIVCNRKAKKCKFSLAMNGSVQHICSRECLSEFRQSPEFYLNNQNEHSKCEQCQLVLKTNDHKWHFMEFCNSDCLLAYQKKCTASQCFLCGGNADGDENKLIISFRAGKSLSDRLFCCLCSQECLDSFRGQSFSCRGCDRTISMNSTETEIFGDIFDNGCMSYFCSYQCMESVGTATKDLPDRRIEKSLDVVVKRKACCSICGKVDFPHHEVNVDDKINFLCSDECFDVFRCRNVGDNVHMCDQCSTLCDTNKLSNTVSAHFGNRDHFFCDEKCLVVFKATSRSFSYCFRCSSKRGKYGILYLNFGDPDTRLFCTPECLVVYWHERVLLSDDIRVSCGCCQRLLTEPKYCSTNNVGTVRLFCSYSCFESLNSTFDKHLKRFRIENSENGFKCIDVDREDISARYRRRTTEIEESSTSSHYDPSKDDSSDNQIEPIKRKKPATTDSAVSCHPLMCERAVTALPLVDSVQCQTDEAIDDNLRRIIPLPLPYICPLPMALYKQPSPVPSLLPVPIPVPVPFKLSSHQKVRDFRNLIKDFVDRIPQDSYENSLILMSSLLTYTDKVPCSETTIPTEIPATKQDDVKIPLDEAWSFKFMYGVKSWDHWISGTDKKLTAVDRKESLSNFTSHELSTLLSQFVFQVRKLNGDQYAPDSLYYLCLGIQAYLHVMKRTEDIFSGFGEFRQFTDRLDSILSSWKPRINESGLLLCRVEEEHLWECKQLGSHSAYVLLNTLVYFNTKHFLLKTPEDHYRLRTSNVVKQSRRFSDVRCSFLRYYDSNIPSGIPREQPENVNNHMRCPVRLFEFYLMKCPESVRNKQEAFYLSPESCLMPDSPYWFSADPLPIDEIKKILNRIFIVKEIQEAYITSQNI